MTPRALFNRYKSRCLDASWFRVLNKMFFYADRLLFVLLINDRQLEYFCYLMNSCIFSRKNNDQFVPKIFVPFIVRFKNGNVSLSKSKKSQFLQ